MKQWWWWHKEAVKDALWWGSWVVLGLLAWRGVQGLHPIVQGIAVGAVGTLIYLRQQEVKADEARARALAEMRRKAAEHDLERRNGWPPR